jgi:hypothetical protein
MLCIVDLPESIQSKICSYLYFSSSNSVKIQKINNAIVTYNENIINYLLNLFENRLCILKYRILKYLVIELDDIRSKNMLHGHKIDYIVSDDLSDIIPLLYSLNIIEINNVYKYVVERSHIL